MYEYPIGGSPITADRPIILKLTHSSHRQVPLILGEIDFTNYLADNGVNVSRAIPSLDGNLVETLEGRVRLLRRQRVREGARRPGGLARVDA